MKKWPNEIPLELKVKDMLEDNVDEKYYLSPERLIAINAWNAQQKPLENMEKSNKSGIVGTITTREADQQSGMKLIKEDELRIRKITPRESFRLMGLDDKSIDLIQNSELISQPKQYFLAGNSIVIPVLEAIFKEIEFPKDRPLKVFETFAGYGSTAIALKNIGYKIETATSEWFTDAIIAYALIHHNEEFYNLYNDLKLSSTNKENYLDLLELYTFSIDSKKPNNLKRMNTKKLIALLAAHEINHNKGSILEIEADNLSQYDLLTYSFPCQDLSLAGKGQGMSKGDNTRSGLLWEIERILLELKEQDKLPKVLLMENVPQIHSKKHINDFEEWQEALVKLGYRNSWKDLNAKNFGIPQNRNRTFMVSFLEKEIEDDNTNN